MTEGLDLSFGREAVEALMEDICSIYPPPDLADDLLDPDTLELTDLDPDSAYYGPGIEPDKGKCKIKITGGLGVGDHMTERGGDFNERRNYTLGIPLSAPPVIEGSIVRCEASKRDPLLAGKEFVAGKPVYGTLVVSRRVAIQLR